MWSGTSDETGTEPLLILILRPSVIITGRLVRSVGWLVSIGIFFTLVRLIGIVWGRCLIGSDAEKGRARLRT